MAQFKFFLKEAKSDKETTILLICFWANQQLKISTGLKVIPNYWNKNLGLVKEVRDYPKSKALNGILKNIRNKADLGFVNLEQRLGRVPDKAEIRELLISLIPSQKEKVERKESGTLEEFIEEESARIEMQLKAVGKPINRNTLACNYKQTGRVLMEFVENRKERLRFNNINNGFYDRFLEYCLTTKNYRPNNVGKHIKNIKALMRKATEQGIVCPQDYKKFKKFTEEVDSIYLNPEELGAIQALELTGKTAHLEKSRDIFIIACWTGLRFSDWHKLRMLNENSDFISVHTQKTNQKVMIPLLPQVKLLLQKYDGMIPMLKRIKALTVT